MHTSFFDKTCIIHEFLLAAWLFLAFLVFSLALSSGLSIFPCVVSYLDVVSHTFPFSDAFSHNSNNIHNNIGNIGEKKEI